MAPEVNCVEIIAHRGASFDAPENTLAAVNLAWKQGADAVEIDVQASSDHRIVVIHDDSTKKTAALDRKVCEQSFVDLCKLDVGRWKSPAWEGERLPSLSAVLDLVPDGKRIFIEIKCERRGLSDLVKSVRASRCTPAQVVLIGFCLATMSEAKTLLPDLEVAWVVKCHRDWKTARWKPTIGKLVDDAKAAGLDALDLGANRPLTHANVHAIKSAGLGVYIWTVDSVSRARQLMRAGVDGIATNKPGWLREQLKLVASASYTSPRPA